MPRKKAAPQRNEASAADAKRAREEADKAAADAARKRARSEAFTRSVTKVVAPLVPEKHRDDDGVEVARLNGVRARRGDDASTSSPASVPTRLTLEVAGDGSKVPRLAWSFADEEKDGSPSGDEREWRPERDPSFHAASALLFLIERGRFALRLDARDATRCTLAVLVAPDALESPTHPEEFARKGHHGKQRAALAWLAPPRRRTLERYAAGIEDDDDDVDDVGPQLSPLVPASHNLLRDVYEAAKPPRDCPDGCDGCAFTELVPTPRPYQRRAVDWMIRRERGGVPAASKRGDSVEEDDGKTSSSNHPLWSRLGDEVYVNWSTGQLTRDRFDGGVAEPSGGILADEMGLGKTVELLMCVLAHRFEPPAVVKEEKKEEEEEAGTGEKVADADDDEQTEEIVGCVCGNTEDDYEGMWLACDGCRQWSHARCVGYTKADETRHRKKADAAIRASLDARAEWERAAAYAKSLARGGARYVDDDTASDAVKVAARLEEISEKKNADADAAAHAPPFLCGACVARRAGEVVSGPCRATLVVCPAPILPQWRAELRRHAKPGAVRVLVYEGQPRDAGGPNAGKRRTKASFQTDTFQTDKGLSNASDGVVSAADLAAADVVLTTYDVLRGDLHHDPLGDVGSRASRHVKRYSVIPTPLTRLTWWRVVLDEAQMVESSTAAAAAMARMVPAVHRWAVTGTPVSRGLEDLQGLFAFLGGPSPFADAGWWRRTVQTPYEAHHHSAREFLHGSLRRLMWRNARADVADELALPPQGQTVTLLRPSGIEAHWYRQQRKVCEGLARDALRRIKDPRAFKKEREEERRKERMRREGASAAWNGRGHRLGRGELDELADLIDDGEDEAFEEVEEEEIVDLTANDDDEDRYLTAEESRKVLQPLLRLRQACNHPQAGTHGVRSLAKGNGGGVIGAGGIHSGVIMTMPQIHAVLIDRQRTEAEEAQRLVAFTLNASAGVAMCRGDYPAAVGHYREVLRLELAGAEDGLNLRLDSLQRLHALHNLRAALEAAGPDAPVARTLRDDSLDDDAETERRKYVAQRAGGAHAAAADLRKVSESVKKNARICGASGAGPAGAAWWSALIDSHSRSADGGRSTLDRLVDNQLSGRWQGREIAFTDLAGLRFALETALDELGRRREEFLDRLEHLAKVTADADPVDVEAAGKCVLCVAKTTMHDDDDGVVFAGRQRAKPASNRERNLRDIDARSGGGRTLCQHCAASPLFKRYEDVLFGHLGMDAGMTAGGRGRIAQADVGDGRSAPSSAEVALKFLATRVPKQGFGAVAAKESSLAHLEMMEDMRREFTRAMILVKHQREEMYARDELAMATTRIRVRASHEVALGGLPDPVPEHLRASVVHEWELDDMEEAYVADRAAYEDDLRKAKSQVRFLERLKDDEEREKGGGDSGPFECPVCVEEVDSSAAAAELAVLPCGHRLCVRCTDVLVSRAPPPAHPRAPRCFKCPTCRVRTAADEVNYVAKGSSRVKCVRWPAAGAGDAADMDASLGTEREQLQHEAALVVKGSWGTKVEAVVRRVMYLLDPDRPGGHRDAKCLVFSEWEDALRVVAAALKANDVPAAHTLGGGRKLRDAIDAFKGVAPPPVGEPSPKALLMPLRRGANGLNLTEAQHVILLEPVLDPGAEAQAMKRVDRIGQTMPTCVHRFLLQDTVEENVQELSRRRREAAPGEAEDVGRARSGSGLRISEVEVLIPRRVVGAGAGSADASPGTETNVLTD